jgi:hypothetical protein
MVNRAGDDKILYGPCGCVRENTAIRTDDCSLHYSSPSIVKHHLYGGKPNSLCFYCGFDQNSEVHSMEGQLQLCGKKSDSGKPQLGLVPTSLILAVGRILTMGAKKYGHHNWRNGLAWSRVYDALLRHLVAWWSGEEKDSESGQSHLWHAACELAFLIEYEETKTGEDDRYKGRE